MIDLTYIPLDESSINNSENNIEENINYTLEWISNQVLEEISVIEKDNKYNIKIGIEMDGSGMTARNFEKDPYFKVFTSGKKFKTTSPDDRTRISLRKAEYIDHNSVPGNLRLNSKQKKNLITLLKSPITGEGNKLIDDEPAETVWEYLLACFNSVCELDKKDKYYLHKDTPMPNYTDL